MRYQTINLQVAADAALDLADNQNIAIRDGVGIELRVLSGVVWLTQDRDARDFVLAANESFRLDRPGLALVHSFGPSRIRLAPARRA